MQDLEEEFLGAPDMNNICRGCGAECADALCDDCTVMFMLYEEVKNQQPS